MLKRAVDIVLLPSEAMMEKAIELNRELIKEFGPKIVLGKERCLPHISLAMGCINEKDVSAIGEILEEVSEQYPVAELIVTRVHTATNSRGEKVSSFVVERTDRLQSLHKAVMEELGPHFKYEATAEMVLSEGEVAETTLEWINSYRGKSSFEKFFPHITLGYGVAKKLQLPMKFSVSRLALCYLGNHCTCRKLANQINKIKN